MKIRALILDIVPPGIISQARDRGVEIDWESNGLLDLREMFEEPSLEERNQLRELRSRDVDVIIIADNFGTGFSRANEIPRKLRSRTMIIWDFYVPGNEEPYVELGFQFFGSSLHIDVFTKMLDSIEE